MASEPIYVADSSNLDQILDEASERPVTVERDGVVYHVTVVEHVEEEWTDADRDAVIAAVEATAGSWPDVDADKMIEDLYEARRLGSRPASRP
ncbi:hypothetical protein BH23CHL1_BH23CHL1_03270 [soil metagenome]